MSAKEYCVAVVGATGAVGKVLLQVLEERRFPVGEIRLLASARSVGTKISFRDTEHAVRLVDPREFDGADFTFFAATGALSKDLAPIAAQYGVVIDKSSTWRMNPEVPLIVPEVNGNLLRDFHRGIIASPNCTTTPFVMVLEEIRLQAGLTSVTVVSQQAVSGAGEDGVQELEVQNFALHDASRDPAPVKVFPARIAANVIPVCGIFPEGGGGYSDEELKLVYETRKILGIHLRVNPTCCTRVPVVEGHCLSMHVETDLPIDFKVMRQLLDIAPGITVCDDPSNNYFPTPFEAAGEDEVFVGRIRQGLNSDRHLELFVVTSNIRKGAALNAVQIAETVIAQR